MSLVCFLHVNAVGSARVVWYRQRGMVPLLPRTQRGLPALELRWINGINGTAREVLMLFLCGIIVIGRFVELLGSRKEGMELQEHLWQPPGQFWLWGMPGWCWRMRSGAREMLSDHGDVVPAGPPSEPVQPRLSVCLHEPEPPAAAAWGSSLQI